MDTATRRSGPTILYDGDCPFCSRYVRLTRLSAAAGPVRLIDIREGGDEVAAAQAAGLDLDQGMVVILDGQLHHGDRAMLLLASLTTGSGLFNRLMRAVFRSPLRARILYPVLVAGRNLTLRLLGRRKIAAARR